MTQKKPIRKDLKIGSLVETMGEFDHLDISRQLGKIISFKDYGYILIEFLSSFSQLLHSGHLNIGKDKHCFYVPLDKILNIIPDELAQKIIANEILPYKASSNLLRIFRRMKFDTKIEYLDISFLNVDEKSDDLITYLPAKKYTGDPEATKGRQSMGVGKMLRKLKPTIEAKELEELVIKYKEAYNFIIEGGGRNIDVVTGENIRYWYSNLHYAKLPSNSYSSELWNSCMSAPQTGKVLNLYCENPDKIALCIYINEEDKLMARALVWKIDNGKVYMDRIYANSPEQKQALINYARENGMIIHNEVRKTMDVTLPKDYGHIHRPSNGNPYMDTFKYAVVDEDSKRYYLTNSRPESNHAIYKPVY